MKKKCIKAKKCRAGKRRRKDISRRGKIRKRTEERGNKRSSREGKKGGYKDCKGINIKEKTKERDEKVYG